MKFPPVPSRVLSVIALSAIGIATPTSAWAACSGEGGYVYVWETCIQNRVSNPRNVCETRKDTRDPQYVVITSNVIFDSNGNRTYPTSVFFDEVLLQQNLSLNGRESSCFDTRREAEDALREYKADRRRYWDDKVRFVTINLPNT